MSGKKKILCKFFIVLNLFMSVHAFAMGSYFSVNSLRDFSKQLPQTQDLIQNALSIANRHLRYEFGSADPRNGGLDCSGTIYYLLRTYHLRDVPRQSDEIYQWVWNKGKFYAVNFRD
jgi:cell wall-associated NlpC family hydrolase